MKKSFLITLIVLCVSLFVTVTAVYAEDGGAGGSDKPVTYTSVEEAGSAQKISGGEPLHRQPVYETQPLCGGQAVSETQPLCQQPVSETQPLCREPLSDTQPLKGFSRK